MLCVLYGGFCGIAHATTVNYNWLVDGTNYAQTTCETGDDLILPTPSPTKYGYHFVGWVESEISGSWSQSGTPTPQNPIEPVFKPFSNTVLRAIGSGDDFVADSYDPETRTITRRIGVKVLDGTETWVHLDSWSGTYHTFRNVAAITDNASCGASSPAVLYSSHFTAATVSGADRFPQADNTISLGSMAHASYTLWIRANAYNNAVDFKQWLADQYNAGTPVTVYYPLATPTEERIQ